MKSLRQTVVAKTIFQNFSRNEFYDILIKTQGKSVDAIGLAQKWFAGKPAEEEIGRSDRRQQKKVTVVHKYFIRIQTR